MSDTNNQRVRSVLIRYDNLSLSTIDTFAGTGVAGFGGDGGFANATQLSSPIGLAVDSYGNLFVADSGNHRIRMINSTTNTITTVVGNGSAGYSGDGGPAALAQLNGLAAVSVDLAGSLYVADTKNSVIRVVATNGIISTVAGNGSPMFGVTVTT